MRMKDPYLICKFCGKTFPRYEKQRLQRHEQDHLGQAPDLICKTWERFTGLQVVCTTMNDSMKERQHIHVNIVVKVCLGSGIMSVMLPHTSGSKTMYAADVGNVF